MKILIKGLLVSAMLTTGSISADNTDYQSVIGSKHDLTTNPAVTGPDNACAFCHSIEEGTGEVLEQLSRNAPVSDITLYDHSRLSTKSEELAPVSSHCMSCHDGQTPFDAVDGSRGTENNNMKVLFQDTTAILGTDLNIHHPVGVKLVEGIYYQGPSAIMSLGLPFFEEKMECSTCHDVHGGTDFGKFMVKNNENSAFCLDCHNK